MKRFLSLICLLALALGGATDSVSYAAAVGDRVPAFPGAEGFGRYTTGGRGGKVYHVTTLDDNSKPGSLRYALNQSGKRIVVFDVCGTIYLNSELRLRNGDVTIAGQTAPGDGICIADYPFQISAKNVIIRYLRFRLGNRNVDQHEGDGLGAMDQADIIVDHCTVSWSVDECCSIYGSKNVTVQWCIIAQSMVNSGHSKGAHGYGGNWGGSGCTYAHNLLLHHTSRTPRLGPRQSTQMDERLDMRNNVIYNWAGNGCYGGEGMNVNIVNNYYKPGPATIAKGAGISKRIASPGIRTTSYCNRVVNADGTVTGNGWLPMWHVWGDYYVDGNVNSKYKSVTADNWTEGIYAQISNGSGVDYTYTQATKDTMRVDTPLKFPYTTTWSASDAYSKVLDYAGCCKPRYDDETNTYSLKHDILDSIMIADTRTGTSYFSVDGLGKGFINTQDDVICDLLPNAWPDLEASGTEEKRAAVDTDEDGIPDYYEKLYWPDGCNPNDACTIHGFEQYTNMDYYLHMLVYARVTCFISSEYTVGTKAIGNYQALGDEVGCYVWGEGDGIDAVSTNSSAAESGACYDLLGNPVRQMLPGRIYVRNGKMFVNR